jgi:hypothetical protein
MEHVTVLILQLPVGFTRQHRGDCSVGKKAKVSCCNWLAIKTLNLADCSVGKGKRLERAVLLTYLDTQDSGR